MPFPVYSAVLHAFEITAPSSQVTIAPDPGFTMVVRDIDIYVNAGVAAGNLYVSDLYSETYWYAFIPPNAGGELTFSWRGRQVFPYVEGTLQGVAFTTFEGTNTWYVRVSGYNLAQP